MRYFNYKRIQPLTQGGFFFESIEGENIEFAKKIEKLIAFASA